MKTLTLIDGSSYLFRAFHALPPLTRKSDGLPVGAVAGFCNMLWKMIEENTGPDAPKRVSVVAITGYLAFLVGPPLLGFLGEHFGLRSAMMVVLALVLVAAIVARAVAKPQSEPVMENS